MTRPDVDIDRPVSASIQSTGERVGRLYTTLGYYAAFVALGLAAAVLGPTLPGLAAHTHSGLSEISFLFTARSLGYLIGSLRVGRLYDRLQGHPLMAATLLLMALMMALVPLTPLLWLLVVILLLLGVAEATVDVGGNTLLVWLYGHKVGPFMNGLHFFFGLGAFLSPVIVAQAVLLSGDIYWAFWGLALLMLPAAIWVARRPSPAIRQVAAESQNTRVNDLLVVLIALFFFLYVGMEVSYGGWIFTYTRTLGLAGEAAAAYLTSAFWGSFTLGRLVSIPLAARFRPRVVLSGDLVGCLLGLAVILLWPGSLAAVWIGTFGVGFSMASIFPTTLSMAENRLSLTGRVTGWFFVGGSAGAMFLPWLIGQLFEPVGPRVVMFALLADLIAALALFASLMIYSRRTAVPETGLEAE